MRLLLVCTIAVFGIVLFAPSPVNAHTACCPHGHTDADDPLSDNTCAVAADCDRWAGLCMEQSLGNPAYYTYCSCLLPLSYTLVLINAMTASGESVPAPDTTITYQTSLGAESFGGLLFDDQPIVEFAPNTPGIEGFVTLTFGTFEIPASVPVTVQDVRLDLPDGQIDGEPLGLSTVVLAPEESPLLTFNSLTGEILQSEEREVALSLSNNMHINVTLRMLWTGEIGTSGDLALILQGTSTTLTVTAVDPTAKLTTTWAAIKEGK